jgi:hypothetical protein
MLTEISTIRLLISHNVHGEIKKETEKFPSLDSWTCPQKTVSSILRQLSTKHTVILLLHITILSFQSSRKLSPVLGL